MPYPLIKSLADPAYRMAVALPRYNTVVTVFQTYSATDGGKVLRRVRPDWTAAQHVRFAEKHIEASNQQWTKVLRMLARAAFKANLPAPNAADTQAVQEVVQFLSEAERHTFTTSWWSSIGHVRAANAHEKAASFLR